MKTLLPTAPPIQPTSMLEAPATENSWRQAVEQLASVIGADASILTIRSPHEDDVGEIHCHSAVPLDTDGLMDALKRTDAFQELRRDTRPFPIAQCARDEETTSADPALAWAWEQDLSVGMIGLIWRERNQMGVMSLWRRDPTPFDQDSVALIESALPQIEVAIRFQAQLDRVTHERDVARAGLDTLYPGIFLLTMDSRIAFANRPAQEILVEDGGVEIRDDRLLPCPIDGAPSDAEFLDRLTTIASMRGDSSFRTARGLRPFTFPRGARPDLTGTMLPLAPVGTEAWGVDTAVAVLLVSTPDRYPELMPGRLEDQFGLTTAETELAVALALGRAIRDIAKDTGRSEATLRKQLQSVFQKTGTHRQTELVAKLLKRAI